MTDPGPIELAVVMDSVVRMREQQLWPHPDLLAFALAAERAGIDAVLLSLHVPHVTVRDRDWRMLGELQRARLCLAAPARSAVLRQVADSAAARCVLIPGSRHEHSSGGALAVGVVRSELDAAVRALEQSAIELGARVDPDPRAVRQCAEAGLRAVELNTAAFALAARPDSRARRRAEIVAAIEAARSAGLRVSVRGGLDYENLGDLIACGGIAEVRIGQALIAQALFDGIEASIARMRVLAGGPIE